jgi:hypothetical protein
MPEVEMFKGTDRRKQNPQNWLLKLEGAKFRYDTPDEQRLYTFSKHLEYGSKAHIWWRDELTLPNKTTWAALEAAFHAKWPPIARAQPTMEEKQAKLFELKLTEDEVGTKVGDDEDDQVYSHIDWVQKVLTIAEDIEDDKGMLISIARNNLPLSIRTLLPNDISTWEKFTDGVSNISISRLTDEVDRDRFPQSHHRCRCQPYNLPTDTLLHTIHPHPISHPIPTHPIHASGTTGTTHTTSAHTTHHARSSSHHSQQPYQRSNRHVRRDNSTSNHQHPSLLHSTGKPSRQPRRRIHQTRTASYRRQHPIPRHG